MVFLDCGHAFSCALVVKVGLSGRVMAVELHEIYWLIVQRHICGNLVIQNLAQACLLPVAGSAFVVQLVCVIIFPVALSATVVNPLLSQSV